MANLTESPVYETGIFQLEKTTPVLGGAPVIDSGIPREGFANVPLQQLANRTSWLKQQVEAINTSLPSSYVSYINLSDYSDITKGAALVGYNGTTVSQTLDKLRNNTAINFVSDFGGISGIANTATYQANTLALQNAVNLASSTGRALYIPAGVYNFANNTATNFSMPGGDIIIFGAGIENTKLVYNDDLGTGRRDFLKGTAKNFGLFDLSIEGTWGTSGDYTERSHLIGMTYTDGAVVQRVKVSKSRYMSMVISGGKTGHVSDCQIYDSVADGIRLTNVNRITIANNYTENVNDDCIAIHVTDASGSPVDRTISIIGNISVNCQGITVLGAKQTIISNNILIRPHTRAILVGCSDATDGSSVEGNTAPLAISITRNLVTDLFRGSDFSSATAAGLGWIVIRNTAPRQGTAAGFVGGPNGSGGVVEPWDYLYTNNIDDLSTTNPGNWFIDISGNSCVRTLKPVANYSAYGFGSRMSRTGPSNPAITQTTFDSVGYQVRVMGQGQNVRVSNNILSGGFIPIWLNGVSGGGYVTWKECYIVDNQVSNFKGAAGIRVGGDGLVYIDKNSVDGDPYNTHPYRVANGKWNASYVTYSAIWLEACRAVIRNNTFRNVGAVFQGATVDRAFWEGNVIACNPTSTNYNTNNIGVGDIGTTARLGCTYIIEDGDPASSTFNTILNICLKGATAMPTTGKYVFGQIVLNAAPNTTGTSGSQYIVTGWLRSTTGSGHTLNTDWRELRCLTGT